MKTRLYSAKSAVQSTPYDRIAYVPRSWLHSSSTSSHTCLFSLLAKVVYLQNEPTAPAVAEQAHTTRLFTALQLSYRCYRTRVGSMSGQARPSETPLARAILYSYIGASNVVVLFRGAPRRARRRPCVGAVRRNSTAGVVRTLRTLVLQPAIGADSWISTQERPQVRPTPAPLRHRHAFFAPFFTDRLPRDHAHPSLDSPKFARHSVSMPCYRSMVGNRVTSSLSPRSAGLSGADAAEEVPARCQPVVARPDAPRERRRARHRCPPDDYFHPEDAPGDDSDDHDDHDCLVRWEIRKP